jgi:hypothetical protein
VTEATEQVSVRDLRAQLDADRATLRDVETKRRAKTATGDDYRAGVEAAQRARETHDELGRRAVDNAARSSALDFMRPGAARRRIGSGVTSGGRRARYFGRTSDGPSAAAITGPECAANPHEH